MKSEDDAEYLLLRFAELGTLLKSALIDAIEDSHSDASLVSNAGLTLLLHLDLEGIARPGDIQEMTGLSSGGVTKLLDRLEQEGLIERSAVEDDGRGVGVTITDEGRRVVQGCASALESWLPDVQRVVKDFMTVLDER